MSLLRHDITTNNWVIFAPERSKRPDEWKPAAGKGVAALPTESTCPFCPRNERLTGPEIYALRGNTPQNGPGWRVRVIANNFPALRIEEDNRRLEDGPLFRYMGGCGAHEVIIESPDHNTLLAQQSV